jgi:hypothetical protein
MLPPRLLGAILTASCARNDDKYELIVGIKTKQDRTNDVARMEEECTQSEPLALFLASQ